jgi:2-oxoglutarate dehydrogenase E2 component (dihydrolipoamide succinyltransferase)
MTVEITIPSPGESITEVTVGNWFKNSGDWVEKDEVLLEIESDKATLEVPSPAAGILQSVVSSGEEMEVGAVIARIDPDAKRPKNFKPSVAQRATQVKETESELDVKATPVARKVASERGVDISGINGTGPGGRVTKKDVLAATPSAAATTPSGSMAAASPATPQKRSSPPPIPMPMDGSREVRRERRSKLRQRIAERLVESQQTTATLTTFNECDMSKVMSLRSSIKDNFAEKNGVGIGFMSFFVKAACFALRTYPGVNAFLDGKEIEYHDYCDIGVAVGTDKGLVVPVLRNAEMMTFADIERHIKGFAIRARDGKLSVEDMAGGTFTVSNGGVYGSMMSTPILNPPQAGILGMHAIKKRAVEDPEIPGSIVLRPMMYLALSYDHRLIDGTEAVGFLKTVKELIEEPGRIFFDC